MIDDIKQDTEDRMGKASRRSQQFQQNPHWPRTPSLLDGIRVEYYGAETPLNQLPTQY